MNEKLRTIAIFPVAMVLLTLYTIVITIDAILRRIDYARLWRI